MERSDPVSEKNINLNNLTIGVCYYPEHWPEEMWEDDLKRMVDYGIKIIRIGEFAWSIFEPEEGVFSFDFFDRFMELVKEYPIKVIFCTPTATPPAWLTEKYPEALNKDSYGIQYCHGLRRHYTYNSEKYNYFVKRIVQKLATHYGKNPSIVGWQIDNEFNCEVNTFYADCDHQAFRQYLKNKYKSLDEVNKHWGTVFWNQTYSNWNQIYLPRRTPKMQHNPHMLLDEKEFISESACTFAKMQSDLLRESIDQTQFITTNGIFHHINYNKMVDQSLDFICYDSYPNFGFVPENHLSLKDRNWSWNLSLTRAISPLFGIMEQQVGPGGWMTSMRGPSPKPGQMRLWTYQSIAHGADYIGYFRWRTCGFGTEIYWHGLNDYANVENRRINELKTISNEFKKLNDITHARYVAKAAIIRSHANEWDSESDTWYGPLVKHSENAWFAAATYSHTPIDVIYIDEINEISNYDFVVWPHPAIVTQKEADMLKAYVENGGKLVLGARTGYKEIHGQCPTRKSPGLLLDLCGASVEDFSLLTSESELVTAQWGNNDYEMPLFNDVLKLETEDATVIATYQANYYRGLPAIIENKIGQGTTLSVGSAFTQEMAFKILTYYQVNSPFNNVIDIPECCELAVRRKESVDYLFVLNYSAESKALTLHQSVYNMLKGEQQIGKIEIEPYGVCVLRDSK